MKNVSKMMVAVAVGCVVIIPSTIKAQTMLAALVRTMPAPRPVVVGAAEPAVVMAPAAETTRIGDQVKDDLFAGTEKFAQGAKEVTEVNLDKSMLGMVNKGKGGDVANKLDFVVVHTYEYEKPGMYKLEDLEIFRKRLTDGTWKCIVHTREKDESTDVCMKTVQNGEATELVVMTAEAKELTFVHVGGRGLNFSDLHKLGSVMKDVPTPPTPPTPPLNRR